MSTTALTFWALLSSVALAGRGHQCIIPSQYKSTHGKASDSPAIEEVFARCSENSEIIFSEGVEYNVFSPLKATNLSNVVVRHLGNLNLPQNISYMQNLTTAAGGSLNWFDIRGIDVSWIGTEDVSPRDWCLACKNLTSNYRSRLAGSTPTDKPGTMRIPQEAPASRTARTSSTST
jgi:hypothetical protein